MLKKLDCYELLIDENKGEFVDAIALVEAPAIESNFIAFSKDKKLKFSFNDEKMELFGAAMIPNMKIYRKDEDGYEYDVFFSKETIRKIAQVFSKRGFQANLNIEHDTKTSADSFTFQSIIVDTQSSIPVTVGDYPDGSWFIGAKVESPDVWAAIKEGKFKGFSVEGIFELMPSNFKKINPTIIKKNDEEAELVEELIKIISLGIE